MATSKKTTKSAAKKPASRGKSASGKGKKAAPKGGSQKRPNYQARVAGGILCFVLAVLSAFGYFGIQALFIDLLVSLERGLFGYGFWVAPVALLWASIILALSRGMPVRLRAAFALLSPLIVGSLVHAILGSETALSLELVGQLWASGLEMTSGGVLGGLLAILLTVTVSKWGAILLMGLLLVSDLLILTKTTPADVLRMINDARDRQREHRAARQARRQEALEAQEGDFPSEPEPLLPRRPSRRGKKAAQAVIDIPVDDLPQGARGEEPPAQQPPKEKPGFLDNLFGNDVPVERPAADYQAKQTARNKEPSPAAPPAAPKAAELPPLEDPKETAKRAKAEQAQAAAQVARDLDEGMRTAPEYVQPPADLLGQGQAESAAGAREEIRDVQARLDDTIHAFGIDAHVVGAVRGPTVTRYELELERGVKLSKVTNLADDIALTLGAKSVRIAPIPGKSLVVGVEVPNKSTTPVHIREVIDSPDFRSHKSSVAFALGKDISGRNVVGNISKLPHMLIAGTTGSGKSVCTNSIIISLLYKSSPEQVRLIMVDPKMVELSVYNGIPHLLIPVVTDPKKAAGALQWAVTEMLKRYRLFSEHRVRDLESYNQAVRGDIESEEQPLPQIVVFIDELADLMLVAAKEVEEAICRLAQMGRAAGMHLIIATQRPSTDVITGLMKANIPSRIALSVASGLESRIILDTQGAEKLLGNGDMLYSPVGGGKPQRVQGCFISDEEVAGVVEFIKSHSEADYDDAVMQEVEHNAENAGKASGKKGGSTLPDATIPEPAGPSPDDGDPMLNDAIDVVVETGMASVSMLQRRLKLGYSRAARLVDQMEDHGIVGPFEGSKPRKVLVTKEEWAERKMQGGALSDLDQAKAMSEAADAALEEEALAQDVDMPPFEV